MRIHISGGPGSGCTSTATVLGSTYDLNVLDSDSYFHKSTDPPYQEQNTPDERRHRLEETISQNDAWILSGSISTWGLRGIRFTHGIFLQVPAVERLKRLELRQKTKFEKRIENGGDMEEEHRAFLEWAEGYEKRTGLGRNLNTDKTYLELNSDRFIILDEVLPFDQVLSQVMRFIDKNTTQDESVVTTPDDVRSSS